MRKIFFLVAVSMVCLMFVSGAIAQPNKFWAMDVGNQWNYQGSCGPGCSYTSQDLVIGIDNTTFGFPTYLIRYTDSGSLFPDHEWYTFSDTELRIWRIQDWDNADGAFNTIDIHNGVTWAIIPPQIGVPFNVNATTTGTFTDNTGTLPITLIVNSVVESYGPVIVPLGTYNAYKIHHDIQVPGLGAFTQNFWVIPYFGVVKREETDIDGTDTESLTGMNIATVFADAPFNYWAYHYIMAIYNDGITLGCVPGAYCPTGNVTREQMASFIVRAVDGVNATQCTGIVFNDVPLGAPHCANIERLRNLNVTLGCGPNLYCPSGNVTRQEMASFLVRAVDGFDATVCTGIPFTDVPIGAPHCANIERLRVLNVTLGCTANTYCPSSNVVRDQMAAFLARAFLGLQ